MLATPELIREAPQWSRMGELLPRWREVPLYRDRLPSPETLSAGTCVRQSFARWPFVTKRELRKDFPRNFLPSDEALESLLAQELVELEHTSGTSEERTPVLFRRGWWDKQEECVLRLNGFIARVLEEHPEARRATITTPVCNGRSCPTVWRSQAQRTFGRTLFVNLARIPFILADAELARMAVEIADWSPQFLDVDPVHGVRFALYCEEHGLRFPSLRFVLCSYEFVSVVHRRILERVFGVPVFNLYGSTETGHLLMEDERGNLKPSHETAFLEVVEPDARNLGELVVTTLTNDLMPLVRYRIGDLVERRELPYATTYLLHGRSRDALRRRDGRLVTTWDVDQCFAGVAGVVHYQLRQWTDGDCSLRFVPDHAGLGTEALNLLTARLEALLQPPGQLQIEARALLPPEYSGKFRLTGPA
ncbi:MAG: hypothetical protein WCV00_02725 [Verrucomicrobiia bacterium]